jgi:hypothetical protein
MNYTQSEREARRKDKQLRDNAPEMLAALEQVVNPSHTHFRKGAYPIAMVNMRTIEQVRAIIKKATA